MEVTETSVNPPSITKVNNQSFSVYKWVNGMPSCTRDIATRAARRIQSKVTGSRGPGSHTKRCPNSGSSSTGPTWRDIGISEGNRNFHRGHSPGTHLWSTSTHKTEGEAGEVWCHYSHEEIWKVSRDVTSGLWPDTWWWGINNVISTGNRWHRIIGRDTCDGVFFSWFTKTHMITVGGWDTCKVLLQPAPMLWKGCALC